MDGDIFREIPIGLGMSLAKNGTAFETYGKLPDGQKKKIVDYIKSAATGDEAKQRIEQVVQNLNHNDTGTSQDLGVTQNLT